LSYGDRDQEPERVNRLDPNRCEPAV